MIDNSRVVLHYMAMLSRHGGNPDVYGYFGHGLDPFRVDTCMCTYSPVTVHLDGTLRVPEQYLKGTTEVEYWYWYCLLF